VISATFQASVVTFSTTPPTLEVELRQVDEPWTESSVTWNNQPDSTNISKINGVGTGLDYYDWDTTGLVQGWLNGATNNGLALWSDTESTFGWRGFASQESVSPPAPPQLIVTYRP
jgi:hypothetical protein